MTMCLPYIPQAHYLAPQQYLFYTVRMHAYCGVPLSITSAGTDPLYEGCTCTWVRLLVLVFRHITELHLLGCRRVSGKGAAAKGPLHMQHARSPVERPLWHWGRMSCPPC